MKWASLPGVIHFDSNNAKNTIVFKIESSFINCLNVMMNGKQMYNQ
jgi:hypothetical protein